MPRFDRQTTPQARHVLVLYLESTLRQGAPFFDGEMLGITPLYIRSYTCVKRTTLRLDHVDKPVFRHSLSTIGTKM